MHNRLAITCIVMLVAFFTQAQHTNKKPLAGENVYHSIQEGKFLRNWKIAGPSKVPKDSAAPKLDVQQRFFENLLSPSSNTNPELPTKDANGATLKWVSIQSVTDQVLFDTLFKDVDYASAFAAAEFVSDRERNVILGLGSDDAVKVYLNGKLVHKNFVGRGILADNDIIPIRLVKGRNLLIIEVQDAEGGWGFMARFLDKAKLADQLVTAAGSGNFEQLRGLLDAGADLNTKSSNQLTPLQSAQVAGRQAVVRFLKSKGAKETPMPGPATMFDGLYGNLEKDKRPGIALLVARDGKVIFNKGYGFSDIGGGIKINPETKFRIGSITKQFIAAAILLLQEQGKLKVSDTLTKYFPDLPRANELTIHHLLTHTSGLHSFTNTDSFLRKVVNKISDKDLYAYIKSLPYDFNPGEKYEYNNSGYVLAGFLVQKVSGQSLNDFLKHHFFDPIGMLNTGMHTSDLKLTNEAKGYNKSDKYEPALDWDMSWAGGAGALYSTVGDLYKWNEAIFNGKVLNRQSLDAAFTPVVLKSGQKPPGTDYGYGWGMNKHRGANMIGHSGGLHGFVSQLVRFPEHNLTVVMLTNQTPVEVELNPARIAEFYLWQKLDSQETYDAKAVIASNLEDYEGVYDLGNNMKMTVTRKGSQLFAEVGGQASYEIFPLKKDEFFWKVVEAKVKFNRNEKGEVVSGSFEQGQFRVTAPRTPLPAKQ